jgi:hypothetical protein
MALYISKQYPCVIKKRVSHVSSNSEPCGSFQMKPPTLKAEVNTTLPSYGTYVKLQPAFGIYDICYLIALCAKEVSFFSTLHTQHQYGSTQHNSLLLILFCLKLLLYQMSFMESILSDKSTLLILIMDRAIAVPIVKYDKQCLTCKKRIAVIIFQEETQKIQ